MNNHSESGAITENPPCPQWGLARTITPCFGAVWYRRATDFIFSLTGPSLTVLSATMTHCTWIRPFR